MEDLSDILKVRNFADVMGYVGYVSGKEEDRRKLYVLETYPLVRKKDGKQFGYSVVTKSIGSGKESRFTVVNSLYNKEPISKGDIIYCKNFERNGQYFRLTQYTNAYKKNYIYLNDYTLYVVEDITGTHTDPYHYKMYFHTNILPSVEVLP